MKSKRTNGRAKGAAGERELANYLKARGYEARRGQQFSGGTDSPDVVCAALPTFHLECKRVEGGTETLYKWMAQSQRDAGKKTPLVVHRKNKSDWLVVMRLEDFLGQIALNRYASEDWTGT